MNIKSEVAVGVSRFASQLDSAACAVRVRSGMVTRTGVVQLQRRPFRAAAQLTG
jgi:hypothetical protein